MEADFHRCYGIDLRDAVETESVRWLWARIQGLPLDSALARVMEETPQRELVTDPNQIHAFLSGKIS